MNADEARKRELLAYEALMHDVADLAADDEGADPRLTDAADAALVEMIDAKLAAIGERRLAQARAARTAERPVRIRAGLLDKSIEWLRSRLRDLQAMVPGEALAASHRDLDELSREDLCSMVADLEALIPGAVVDEAE